MVVIGLSEADNILERLEQVDSLDALSDVEFSVKRSGLKGHKVTKLRDLATELSLHSNL